MGTQSEANSKWSVFDGVKTIPSSPESLMAEINKAISALEHARATALLGSPPSTSSSPSDHGTFDAKVADEAYKAGRAAMASGKPKEALRSLNLALSKCPPDRTSAISKLRSLISLASHQLQRSAPPKREA